MIDIVILNVSVWCTYTKINWFKIWVREGLEIILLKWFKIYTSDKGNYVINFIHTLYILYELLCVASNLGMSSLWNHLSNCFPVLAKQFESWMLLWLTIYEYVMFFWGPTSYRVLIDLKILKIKTHCSLKKSLLSSLWVTSVIECTDIKIRIHF